jgi:hypothetical protein
MKLAVYEEIESPSWTANRFMVMNVHRTARVRSYESGVGIRPIAYGRIISLSSCSTMWQCHTNSPSTSNRPRTLVTSPGTGETSESSATVRLNFSSRAAGWNPEPHSVALGSCTVLGVECLSELSRHQGDSILDPAP